MGHGSFRERGARVPPAALLVALAAAAALLLPAGSAAAAGPISKDGRVHACYKAKGKNKGAMRVAVNAKAKCPKGWRKLAWNSLGQSGAAGENGVAGENGAAGGNGEKGAAGANGAASQKSVTELEKQVTDLLGKIQSLETILAGVTNGQLKEAIAAVPVVGALCTQATELTSQANGLGSVLSSGFTILKAVFPTLPAVPAFLPAFSCPAT